MLKMRLQGRVHPSEHDGGEKLASNETVCYRNKEVLRMKRLYIVCITLCIVSMLTYIKEVDTMGLLL